MKYLKSFNNHSQYVAFTQTEDFILPNVSHCISENDVHYNPIPDPYNGIAYVDMGFPSGTKWATMNVGATDPTEVGNYYTWGETTGYNRETDTLPEYDEDVVYDKYTSTDNKIILEPGEDAARVNMGGEWVTPSINECMELLHYTYREPIFQDNSEAKGESSDVAIAVKLTSLFNGNYIILPVDTLWVAETLAKRSTDLDAKDVTHDVAMSYFWTNQRYELSESKNASNPDSLGYGVLVYYYKFSSDPIDIETYINTDAKASEQELVRFIREKTYMPVRGVIRGSNTSVVMPLTTSLFNNGSLAGGSLTGFDSTIIKDEYTGLTDIILCSSLTTDSIKISAFGDPENIAGYTISLYRQNQDVICSDLNLATVMQKTVETGPFVLSDITINSSQTYTDGEVLSGYIGKGEDKMNIQIQIHAE